jgi:hypothetical protein
MRLSEINLKAIIFGILSVCVLLIPFEDMGLVLLAKPYVPAFPSAFYISVVLIIFSAPAYIVFGYVTASIAKSNICAHVAFVCMLNVIIGLYLWVLYADGSYDVEVTARVAVAIASSALGAYVARKKPYAFGRIKLRKFVCSPFFWLGLSFIWYFALRFTAFAAMGRDVAISDHECNYILSEIEQLGRFPALFCIVVSILLSIDLKYHQKSIPIFWGMGMVWYFTLYLISFLAAKNASELNNNVWLDILYKMGILGDVISLFFMFALVLIGIVYIRQRYVQKLIFISFSAGLIWYLCMNGLNFFGQEAPGPCCLHCF